MLSRLDITNYAIIDNVSIAFAPELNCLTGETGAGKSIIMGALGLILGRRADTKVLNDPDVKCTVEAQFSDVNDLIKDLLFSWEIDVEPDTLIRREINVKGKTRAFINDTPVKLNQIRELSKRLISLHQQFDTMDVVDEHYQIDMLDAFAGNMELRSTYLESYEQYLQHKDALKKAVAHLKKANLEKDYKSFLLNELVEANLGDILYEELEKELEMLQNAEQIRIVLSKAVHELEDSPNNIIDSLRILQQEIDQFSNFSDVLAAIAARLESASIELADLIVDIHQQNENVISDPHRLEELEEKRSLIFKLQKKHQVTDFNQLIELKSELEQEIYDLDHLEEKVFALENELNLMLNKLEKLASQLHTNRIKHTNLFSKRCIHLLKQLSMPHARFEIVLDKSENLRHDGGDLVAYRFSSNPGKDLKDLKDVASGGEMSRLALCLKSIIGEKLKMPTLIFDEIDTGISGEVAIEMGKILKQLSLSHQIVSITHSPQIAGQAITHFSVYKEYISGNTFTRIRKLDKPSRIEELASMISGKPPSKIAMKNAEEMLNS